MTRVGRIRPRAPGRCCGMLCRMGRAALRGRPWDPSDLTGGPVDDVFARLRSDASGVVIERLEVTHAGDDDNLFFVGDERGFERVHVEVRPGGQPPFLIEGEERFETSDVAQAVAVIRLYLERDEAG